MLRLAGDLGTFYERYSYRIIFFFFFKKDEHARDTRSEKKREIITITIEIGEEIKCSVTAHENDERRVDVWKPRGKNFDVDGRHVLCGDPNTA